MPQPPDQVPPDLSAHEYKRLVALYTLMGRHGEAQQAMTHLSDLEAARAVLGHDFDPELPTDNDLQASPNPDLDASPDANANPSKSDEDRGTYVGKVSAVLPPGANNQEFVFTLVRLLKHLARGERAGGNADSPDDNDKDEHEKDVDDELDPMQAMREQLLNSGLSEEESDKYIDDLRRAIKEMAHSEPPPRDVPQDLEAAEYLELGYKYKEVGWTEQARDALTMAIELDGGGEYGQRAQRFLRSKIPRHPVPLKAEQLNIEGYNLMFMKDEAAAGETFETLIRDYPDFEWPYGNLGSLLIRQGELERAEKLLRRAVDINPYYVNGWLHLTRVYGVQERYEEAYECLDRVKAIDPADTSVVGIRDLVDQLRADHFR